MLLSSPILFFEIITHQWAIITLFVSTCVLSLCRIFRPASSAHTSTASAHSAGLELTQATKVSFPQDLLWTISYIRVNKFFLLLYVIVCASCACSHGNHHMLLSFREKMTKMLAGGKTTNVFYRLWVEIKISKGHYHHRCIRCVTPPFKRRTSWLGWFIYLYE